MNLSPGLRAVIMAHPQRTGQSLIEPQEADAEGHPIMLIAGTCLEDRPGDEVIEVTIEMKVEYTDVFTLTIKKDLIVPEDQKEALCTELSRYAPWSSRKTYVEVEPLIEDLIKSTYLHDVTVWLVNQKRPTVRLEIGYYENAEPIEMFRTGLDFLIGVVQK